MRRPAACALFAFLVLSVPLAFAAPTDLATHAEHTGFRETGRYDEVIRLCEAFARTSPREVRCFEFGRTPEGRPMMALAASRSGALTPEEARRRKVPVVLAQGGIHAGEIDGKDAGFLLLREMLEGGAAQDALRNTVFLFVPVFNVDGHERFGRWNRPNQRGPEAMGWRTTGENLNLNRDYMKADAPEMRAMLALANAWDPIVTLDLHVTDGARFQHDVAIMVEPAQAGDAHLQIFGRALRDGVVADLAAQGSHPLPFYPSFVVDDDPLSGIDDLPPPARFSHGYFQERNRFAMLVETHSWKDYATRVRVTRNVIAAVLARTASQGGEWLEAAAGADARARELGGQPVVLDFEADPGNARTIDFLGYAYERRPSAVSGALVTHYDEARPQVWRLSIRGAKPRVTVTAPRGGYLVPAAHAARVAERLRVHGIAFRVLRSATKDVEVEAFRATGVTFAPRSYEGRQAATFEGTWQHEVRTVERGALFVPIAQPLARLVVALFEPRGRDSLAAWGFFNAAFEKKEGMEAYVAEEVAATMLAKDPEVAQAFAKRLETDPAFAKDPAARLEFFHRRHPSWDERYNLYPVLRTNATPPG